MSRIDELYAYIMETALINGFTQTEQLLPYVCEKHDGMFRKGEPPLPYVVHPLMMARHAIALGFMEDDLLSVALLHDVCEDCDVPVEDLPVNEATKHSVALLTKKENFDKAVDNRPYYDAIAGDRMASIVKILDRCNNISSMSNGFSQKKMQRYAKETTTYLYELIERTIHNYPEIREQMYLLHYHVDSVLNFASRMLN